MKLKLLSAALVLALLFSCAAPVSAEDGTVHIRSAEDFRAFVQDCSYDAWSVGKTVVLERDISLGGVEVLPAASFGGLFDGKGHTISGFELSASVAPAGLFGTVERGGVVRNLRVEGSVSPEGSGAAVGGIVGLNRGWIMNCAFSGTVSGKERVGGIVGENTADGVVERCLSAGGVFAMRMTGGVAGSNSGTLRECVNQAYVNTNTADPKLTLSELSFDVEDTLRRLANPDSYNVVTDSGGVSGWSDGLMESCTNHGTVGYQHIGYNVGGITGRSSGFVSGCKNFGAVYGRKDIGGIVGVAEPYVQLNLSGNQIETLRGMLDTLNAQVNQALNDASGSAAAISARLSAIGSDVNNARAQTRELAEGVKDTLNEAVGELNRGSRILSDSLPMLRSATGKLVTASGSLNGAVNAFRRAEGELDSVELRRAMEELSGASELLKEATEEMQAALNTLEGAMRPAEGLSQEEWEARIFGTTDEDGGHVDGAMDELRGGLGLLVQGLAGVTGVWNTLAAGLQDGSVTSLEEAYGVLRDGGLAEALETADAGMQRVSAALSAIEECTQFDGEAPRVAFQQLQAATELLSQGAAGDGKGAFSKLRAAFDAFAAAGEQADQAAGTLEEGSAELADASAEATEALGDFQKLLDFLCGQKALELPSPTASAGDTDALYASLSGLSDQLALLNGESKNASDLLQRDIRAINNQFMLIMYAVLDRLDEAGSYSAGERIEDTSDEDIDAATLGKLLDCVNSGTVSGDIDVGGVAGAMLVYNALNPEGDAQQPLSALIHRSYELKCILQSCANYGAVSAKRSHVSAVCGDGQLGIISGCLACGSAQSESGDYVGGIAGRGDNILRDCWARCSLSGSSCIGGIVGSGAEDTKHLRVERCRSLVEIRDAGQYAGAISGTDLGSFSENLFVSDTLAGLNRSSVQGMAEPIEYAAMLEQEGLPEEFRSFTLRFVAGQEEIERRSFAYGDGFDSADFPAIPEREGCYGVWDHGDLRALHFDTTVTARYEPFVTALPSEITRVDDRPVFFAEGSYTDRDALPAAATILRFTPERNTLRSAMRATGTTLLEQWTLTVPEDGAASHRVRFLPPRTAHGRLEIYRAVGESWEKLPATAIGSYLCVELPAGESDLSLVSVSIPWWVWAAAGLLQLAIIALVITLLVRKKAKGAATEEEQKRTAVFRRRKKRVALLLLALILLLGTASALWLRSSHFTRNQELYLLLRSFAERSDSDMDLSLVSRGGERELHADLRLYTTRCAGKRLACAEWKGVRVYYCDETLFLENGRGCAVGDALPDATQLLGTAAALYRSMEIEVSEENDLRIFHAAADSPQTLRQIEDCLPMTLLGGQPQSILLDLLVRDGEPERLELRWSEGEKTVSVSLEFNVPKRSHEVPLPVQNALAGAAEWKAEEAGENLLRLLEAWAELSAREPLSAEVKLRADCGPLQMDETVTWQRTLRYPQTLSRLTYRGTTLYLTDTAACAEDGTAVSWNETAVSRNEELLRMAYEAVLLGETETEQTQEGLRCSVTLDSEAMDRFAAVIAPEAELSQISFQSGSVRLSLSEDRITELRVVCEGRIRVVRRDVKASISTEFRLKDARSFPALPTAVSSALGLEESRN